MKVSRYRSLPALALMAVLAAAPLAPAGAAGTGTRIRAASRTNTQSISRGHAQQRRANPKLLKDRSRRCRAC